MGSFTRISRGVARQVVLNYSLRGNGKVPVGFLVFKISVGSVRAVVGSTPIHSRL